MFVGHLFHLVVPVAFAINVNLEGGMEAWINQFPRLFEMSGRAPFSPLGAPNTQGPHQSNGFQGRRHQFIRNFCDESFCVKEIVPRQVCCRSRCLLARFSVTLRPLGDSAQSLLFPRRLAFAPIEPGGGSQPGHECERERNSGCAGNFVPPDEFLKAVGAAGRTGRYDLIVQVTADICGEQVSVLNGA